MLLLHILMLLLPLVAGDSDIDYLEPNPRLLDGLEFSLVFPRNETYAPTQYFPIVIAVRNPIDVWPLGLHLKMVVWPHDEEVPPIDSDYNFPFEGYTSGSSPTSSPYFFAINGTNLTNGTTGTFILLWYFMLQHTCREGIPRSDPIERIYKSNTFRLKFTTAHGAPLPDIEAAVDRCPNSTALLKPYGLREYGNCPLVTASNYSLDYSLPPVADPCLVKPFAKGLAANVSEAMLELMGCPDGEWQTIKQPCPPKETKKSGGLRSTTGLKVAWILLLATIICAVL